MNLGVIPLLIVALVLMTTESNAESVEVVLSGQHQVAEQAGALIVGDADVTIPPGVAISGPIYVIGGELVVSGVVSSDVVQLAGTVRVSPQGRIGDELRHIGGTESVAPGAAVGRRTGLDLVPESGGGLAGLALPGLSTLLLVLAGALMEKRRRPVIDNAGRAIRDHPLVMLTVGALLTMTAIALFVFMAFTLVLLPLALIGIVIGVLTVCYAVIVWGHLIGAGLPVRRRSLATGIGVIIVVAVLQLVGLVPVVGDVVVFGVVLSGVGAVIITYYGLVPFRPVPLPHLPEP